MWKLEQTFSHPRTVGRASDDGDTYDLIKRTWSMLCPHPYRFGWVFPNQKLPPRNRCHVQALVTLPLRCIVLESGWKILISSQQHFSSLYYAPVNLAPQCHNHRTGKAEHFLAFTFAAETRNDEIGDRFVFADFRQPWHGGKNSISALPETVQSAGSSTSLIFIALTECKHRLCRRSGSVLCLPSGWVERFEIDFLSFIYCLC